MRLATLSIYLACSRMRASQAWRLLAGEPYRGPPIGQMVREFAYKGILTISGMPAPLLVENGFTDDLFTAQQALEVQNYAFSQNPNAEVSLQLSAGGYPPATNSPELVHAATERGVAFLEAKLKASAMVLTPGAS